MLNVIIVANKVTLKGTVNREFLETMFFSKNNPFRMPLPSGLCGRCGKGRHWTNECSLTWNIVIFAFRKLLEGGLLQAPMPNLV